MINKIISVENPDIYYKEDDTNYKVDCSSTKILDALFDYSKITKGVESKVSNIEKIIKERNKAFCYRSQSFFNFVNLELQKHIYIRLFKTIEINISFKKTISLKKYKKLIKK